LNCLNCTDKACKLNLKDCNNNRTAVIERYLEDGNAELYRDADDLVSGGRAGSLSRLEEIIEFCRNRNYRKVGLAYCYGMENLAVEVAGHLKSAGLNVRSYRCTINGIPEEQIDPGLGPAAGCNPVGQAMAVNQEGVDFVIEMGLCLGHDVLFHRELEVPHTVFIVKDRVFRHNPALALEGYRDGAADFLENIDNKFAMIQPELLEKELAGENPPIVLDVRAEGSFEAGHIPGSINIPLRELPSRWRELLQPVLPEGRKRKIVCVCGGGIQSAYALMFLRSRGFGRVYNLSGGIGRWEHLKRSIP
jgi:uncharacterized metal-binding protein/rhodanese-related sulfurtransferase